jgi:hypothetical protein
MNKKRLKKIVLSKETLRHLTATEIAEGDLARAAGGAFPISGVNTCRCPTVSCKAGQC